MALTGPVSHRWKPDELLSVRVKGGQVIYKSAIVSIDAAGLAVAGKGARVVGVADETADATGLTDSEIRIKVRREGSVQTNYDGGGATEALVGKDAFVVDDNTITDTAGTAGERFGIFTDVNSTDLVRIAMDTKGKL